jgi:predicted nucleic acid-binding protein
MGMSRIFWDTNLFVYLLEGAGESFQLTRSLLARMAERQDELLTSALTLGELLVKPIAQGRPDEADRYEKLLDTPGVRVLSFDRASARHFARIRQDRSIRAPDAIQLSCAAAAQTDLFVTNDDRLSRKRISGVHFIVPLKQVFL